MVKPKKISNVVIYFAYLAVNPSLRHQLCLKDMLADQKSNTSSPAKSKTGIKDRKIQRVIKTARGDSIIEGLQDYIYVMSR